MKYLSIPALTLFLMLAPNSLLAEEKPLQAKLVVVSANTKFAEEYNDLKKLMNNSSYPALRLTFIVKAKDIVKVIPRSMIIKPSKGWTCVSSPIIDEERGAAVFIIEKKGEFLGKTQDMKVEGTINILTGIKLIPKTFSLLTFDEPFRVDDFVFTLVEGKLKIKGNHSLIKEISVEYNDKILENRDSGSIRWRADYRTYNYIGIGKGAKITFSYWDGLVIKKVHFSKK